ncbi:gamma-glutamyltransferase [Glaciecola siphonariae]|uniref:Glutathione hydrolase proenzyme n=1 Tax=Glaciecola siphonariae TaxID=521012 RepID=A0ABV9LRX7_9ALTE
MPVMNPQATELPKELAKPNAIKIKVASTLLSAAFFIITSAASAQVPAPQLNDTGQSTSPVQWEDREPEAATGRNKKQAVVGEHYMVAAANPHASQAGKRILEQGGSAIDAAIAVQAMLTLVEPQSSGIGGGAFILYWDNTAKQLYTFDGREVAPANTPEDVFFKNGEQMSWRDSVVGGKSVGVPGVLKALDMAHKKHGKLPWEQLFNDTIYLAKKGFEVSPRLAGLLARDLHPALNHFEAANAYFKPGGEWLKAGQIRTNEALANNLEKIAKQGVEYFYSGALAEQIAEAVRLAPINPSRMSTRDLRNYQAIERLPMCGDYRSYKVCGMAPPSSGGVSVYQILNGLEQFELSNWTAQSTELVHAFSQASALAFADRAVYLADLDFMGLSAKPLVAPDYLASRRALISLYKPFEKATEGKPYAEYAFAQDDAYELNSTSHIAIVDKHGNAVSMTSSIEFMFGSGVMVGGFLLNNQLTDFALSPERDGLPVLNRVEAFKRPRSSMSPTMVFDEQGELSMVVGSPGGSRIINYVAQALINVIDFDMDMQEAISAPRFTNRNDYTALEKGTSIESLAPQLKALGHDVRIIDLNSGIHGIQIKDKKLIGGADPRREGLVTGR